MSGPQLRESIERLYSLNRRAERGGDIAARRLARALDATPIDLWRRLSPRIPQARGIPTAAEVLAPETRQSAVSKLAGLWVDRSEVGEVDVNRMSNEELKDYLCERYGEERGNEFFGWLEKMGVLNNEPSTESPVIYSRSSLKNRLPRSSRRRR